MAGVTSPLLQPSSSAPCPASATRAAGRGCAVHSGAARGGANLTARISRGPRRVAPGRRGATLAGRCGRRRQESHPARGRWTLAPVLVSVPGRRAVVAAGSRPSAPRTAPLALATTGRGGASDRAASEAAVAAAATSAPAGVVAAGRDRGAEGHTLARIGDPACPRPLSSGVTLEGCSAHKTRRSKSSPARKPVTLFCRSKSRPAFNPPT